MNNNNASRTIRDCFESLRTKGVKFTMPLMRQVDVYNRSVAKIRKDLYCQKRDLVADLEWPTFSSPANFKNMSALELLDAIERIEFSVESTNESINNEFVKLERRVSQMFSEIEKLLLQVESEGLDLAEANLQGVLNIVEEELNKPLRLSNGEGGQDNPQSFPSPSFIQCGGTG